MSWRKSILHLLIWVSLVAASPNYGGIEMYETTEMEITTDVTPTVFEIETTTAPSPQITRTSYFQMGFGSFKRRIISFIEGFKRNQLAAMSNTSRFREEVNEYFSKLKTNVTTYKIEKYRDSCDCDGSTNVSPCPERCLYSCSYKPSFRLYADFQSDNDCRERDNRGECYCSKNLSVDCKYSIEKCVQERTVGDDSCSMHRPDKEKIFNSFELFVSLLNEPVRMFLRGIETRLTLLEQSALTVDQLSTITSLICIDDNDTDLCTADVPHVLGAEKKNLQSLKRNLTREILKTQDLIEGVTKSIGFFKEQTIGQVKRSMKEYACCLTAMNFNVEGYECTELPTTVKPKVSLYNLNCPPTVSFLCSNRNCIPLTLTCDGADDCGDMSDEENC